MIMPRIRDFYRGKSVFLTGVTGSLGKCIVFKLLKSCPEVDKISLLIRASSPAECQKRFNKVLSSQVFEHARQSNPSLLKKLQWVQGDITEPCCGIREEQLKKMDAQVIIHSAASLNFVAPLVEALNLNTFGTKNVLDVAKQSRDVKAFVYISTAFIMPYQRCLDEIVYPNDIVDVDFALDCIPKMPPAWVKAIEKKIRKERFNTYMYTKHLSEILVSKLEIPTSIVRPSSILAGYEEPFPGWNETDSGFSQYSRAIFSGVLRPILHRPDGPLHIASSDHVVNTILASAWRAGTSPEKKLQVYNAVCPLNKTATQSEFHCWATDAVKSNPYSNMNWSPNRSCTGNERHYRWSNAIFRVYPALVRDFLNGRTRGGLADEVKKAGRFTSVYYPFLLNNWDFKTENLQALEDMLSPEDKKEFPVSMSQINWKTFAQRFVDGIRIYDKKLQSST